MTDPAPLDPARIARTTLDPYPHHVRITAGGETLAETTNALLLRETFAPEICIPAADVREDLLRPGGTGEYCPYKRGTPALFGFGDTPTIAWRHDAAEAMPNLSGHYAFDFDKVTIEVDGTPVRGHVRDPKKTISVTPVAGRLTLTLGARTVVDTRRALLLEESELPARYYVPLEDVDPDCLAPSDRRTVCTYKGEATYWHLRDEGREVENAIWTYAEPWTDFAVEIGRIAGHVGFYTSTFDRATLDGDEIGLSEQEAAADRAMIAKPTVDRVLREKSA